MTDTPRENLKRLREEVASLSKMVTEQGIRLTLAQAWIDFYQYAYDALRAYGVDFKRLNEFHKVGLIEEARELPITQARAKIITYIGELRNGVRAAIRRKNFKVH